MNGKRERRAFSQMSRMMARTIDLTVYEVNALVGGGGVRRFKTASAFVMLVEGANKSYSPGVLACRTRLSFRGWLVCRTCLPSGKGRAISKEDSARTRHSFSNGVFFVLDSEHGCARILSAAM